MEVGTAHFTATGKGRFSGTLEGTFEIVPRSLYNILYAYEGAGTAADPYRATVTGVEYTGTRDSFELRIPATVEHQGRTYTVTAVGRAAFGGEGSSSFSGSLANTSKLKLRAVELPATVERIDAFAFGTNANGITAPLERIEFALGSKLTSIGASAFRQCKNLASISLPENLASLEASAFRGCTALKEMSFATRSATLPDSVAKDAFYSLSGVTVHGFESVSLDRKSVV